MPGIRNIRFRSFCMGCQAGYRCHARERGHNSRRFTDKNGSPASGGPHTRFRGGTGAGGSGGRSRPDRRAAPGTCRLLGTVAERRDRDRKTNHPTSDVSQTLPSKARGDKASCEGIRRGGGEELVGATFSGREAELDLGVGRGGRARTACSTAAGGATTAPAGRTGTRGRAGRSLPSLGATLACHRTPVVRVLGRWRRLGRRVDGCPRYPMEAVAAITTTRGVRSAIPLFHCSAAPLTG